MPRHYDHIDLRVSNLAQVTGFYEMLLPALGFTRQARIEGWLQFEAGDVDVTELFGVTESAGHKPNENRIAFWAESVSEVERLAEVARRAGARNMEGPMLYEQGYHAVFFEDPCGNRLEICHRAQPSGGRLRSPMKSCSYCGREGADEATHCLECGSEFMTAEVTKPRQPRDWIWIKAAFGYVGVVFLILIIYLLSFGPVKRYAGVVISQSSTTNASGFTAQVTIQYPTWVGIVYYPIFSFAVNGGDGGLGDLYWRYLEWWENPRTQE